MMSSAVNVHVTSNQRQSLGSIAAEYEGEFWSSEFSAAGWTWELEFPNLEQASSFIAALPEGCSGELLEEASEQAPIQIRAPKFELYELVTLHWNSQERRTLVVQRWFNPDDGINGYWFYKVSEDDKFYPEEVLEPRAD